MLNVKQTLKRNESNGWVGWLGKDCLWRSLAVVNYQSCSSVWEDGRRCEVHVKGIYLHNVSPDLMGLNFQP